MNVTQIAFYGFTALLIIGVIANVIKSRKERAEIENYCKKVEQKTQDKLELALVLQSTMNGTANQLCDWLDNAKEENVKFDGEDYEFFQTVKVKMFQAAALSKEDWLNTIPSLSVMLQDMDTRIKKYPTSFKF